MQGGGVVKRRRGVRHSRKIIRALHSTQSSVRSIRTKLVTSKDMALTPDNFHKFLDDLNKDYFDIERVLGRLLMSITTVTERLHMGVSVSKRM